MGQPTLLIAAGHGVDDPGNTTTGHIERDELIHITAGMRRWFELNQYRLQQVGGVVFIDNQLALAGEVHAIRAWRPRAADGDVAINIHLDYRRGGSGALAICNQFALAQRLSHDFLEAWCKATGIKNNGVHDSRTWARTQRGWNDMGFCAVDWPAIILELGCLNSDSDMTLVLDAQIQALAAQLLGTKWAAAR